MGSFREIDGDLIKMFQNGEFDVIAHGCNCFATMGAGIALTIGKQFPEAKEADEVYNIPNGKKRLGKYTFTEVDIKNKKTGNDLSLLFNLYTQFMPGPDFRIHAFTTSLKNMRKEIKTQFSYDDIDTLKEVYKPDTIKIGLPLIGCGIAGGDWKEVSKIIQNELSAFDVTIVHFKQLVMGVNYFPTPKKKVKWNELSDDEFEEYLKMPIND